MSLVVLLFSSILYLTGMFHIACIVPKTHLRLTCLSKWPMLKIYACVPERRRPCLCEPSFFFSVIFDMPCGHTGPILWSACLFLYSLLSVWFFVTIFYLLCSVNLFILVQASIRRVCCMLNFVEGIVHPKM